MRRKFILKQDRMGVAKGTPVYEYTSYDYGLSRDDTLYLGEKHISVTEASDGSEPFITAPISILEEV